jgi:hypothetical protein
MDCRCRSYVEFFCSVVCLFVSAHLTIHMSLATIVWKKFSPSFIYLAAHDFTHKNANLCTCTHRSLRMVPMVLSILPGSSLLRRCKTDLEVVEICWAERAVPFSTLQQDLDGRDQS